MASETVRAIRGATTVVADTPEQIAERTIELLAAIVEANELVHDQVISILFTVTEDISSAFPATAARLGGFDDAALMCAREIPVPGSLAHCIRLMMHVSTERERSQIENVYLHGAQGLRDDTKR